VPGPLESQRRMGKRRMTHVSERISTPAHGIAAFWGPFGEPDRTQWQWEAPTIRETKSKAATPKLPRWLAEWGTTQDTEPHMEAVGEISKKIKTKREPILADFAHFRTTIRDASLARRPQICDDFNATFKQKLLLGLVSEDLLVKGLETVSKTIRGAFSPDTSLANSQRLLFYQAAWDGLSSCKIFRPHDYRPSVMKVFVKLLSELPVTLEVQELVVGIYSASSDKQRAQMEAPTTSLMKAWVQGWSQSQPRPCKLALSTAENAVFDVTNRIVSAQNLIAALATAPASKSNVNLAREAIQFAKAGVILGLDSTNKLEDTLTPSKKSVRDLAKIMGYLSPVMMSRMVRDMSDYVTEMCKESQKSTIILRYSWLSVVAQIPCAYHTLFLKTWKIMESCGTPLPENQCSDIILNRWITQGYISNPALVKNSLDVLSLLPSSVQNQGFIHLVLAMDRHGEDIWVQTAALFDVMHKVGRFTRVYDIICAMNEAGMKLPALIFARTINTMAKYSPSLALKTYNLYYHLRVDYQYLRLDTCPYFLLSMVNWPQMPPFKIWKMLHIPMYENMESYKKSKHSFSDQRVEHPITKPMVTLLTRMAIAFAYSDARSQRVAFRQVMQCLHHLRRLHAPVTPELTRALVHAGITRKIDAGQWVPKARVQWVLGLIHWAEGGEVAKSVDDLVRCWNLSLTEQKAKGRREMNVLRVGPID
jgi:hypothetical protein